MKNFVPGRLCLFGEPTTSKLKSQNFSFLRPEDSAGIYVR